MSTNGSTTPRSSNRPKFSAQVQDLLGAAKKVINYEKEIVTLDQILDERKELEGKLKSKAAEVLAKDKVIASKDQEISSLQLAKKKEIALLQSAKNEEIAKLQSKIDSFFEEFQQRYKAWDTGTTKQEELAGEVAQLTLKLGQATKRADSSKGELTLLQQELVECRGALKDAEDKLKIVSKELGSKDRELTGTVTELEYLQEERKALGLEDLDHRDLATKFGDFAEQCHLLAKRFFFTQLPADVTQDDLRGKLRSSGFAKIAPKSIPLSNSPQSQYLRMAAAEKVIACKLHSNVFLQYYLPDSVPARQAMDNVLELLSQSSPRKESIFRLRLLSAYKNEQREHLRDIVAITSSDVISILDPLLQPNSRDGFQSDFKKLLHEAFQLWAPVQRSAVTAIVENDPEPDWGRHGDYDAAMGPNADQVVQVGSNPIEPLFPRVSIGDDVVCPGYALWSGQNTVVAAGIEYSQVKSTNQTHTQTNSSHSRTVSGGSERRRLSLSGSVSSRSGDTPTSPKNQSFLSHLNSRKMANP